MKVKFITAIYSNLYGTKFGGRPSRGIHYRYSMLSLLKMTAADFVLYTSTEEYEDLVKFFYIDNNIKKSQLLIKPFNLTETKYYSTLQSKKDIDKVKKSDRCYELQYSKFFWLSKESTQGYTHMYWIDAGLSHVGILPEKYIVSTNKTTKYFTYDLFSNRFLTNLVTRTEDRLFIIGKDNTGINYWSSTVPREYYSQYSSDIHIIGGLFGGKVSNVEKLCNKFETFLIRLLNEKELYFEEQILTAIYYNNILDFHLEYFQIWWYEENGIYPPDHEIYKTNKSFYRVIESLQ